jgi:exo-beta-1,3-glucanase (GH17 family)
MHPGRLVVIGETGWATSAIDEGQQGELIKGRPGEAEQKLFYEAVRDWAGSEREIVFFFEAFDENWKGGTHPAEVEKHWGLFRADRSAKAAMSGPAGSL